MYILISHSSPEVREFLNVDKNLVPISNDDTALDKVQDLAEALYSVSISFFISLTIIFQNHKICSSVKLILHSHLVYINIALMP